MSGGFNFRFLEQNTNSINADLKFSYSLPLQGATRGSFYDSNNDGQNDMTSNGNSAQVSPDFSFGVAGGKKMDKFEVYGLIGFQFSTAGNYKAIKGNTDLSDQKINRDAYGAFIYQLGAQIQLAEKFFIYGSVTQAVISTINEDYTDANGDKNEMEARSVGRLGLNLGAKVAIVPNQVFVYGELHGAASVDQKIVTKTNGTVDNTRDNIKTSTTGSLTVGLLASF